MGVQDTMTVFVDDFALEQASTRLAEILSLIEAIETGELLADAPASPGGRLRHQTGVNLLAIVQREVTALIRDIRPTLA